jgi:hypothetical protein
MGTKNLDHLQSNITECREYEVHMADKDSRESAEKRLRAVLWDDGVMRRQCKSSHHTVLKSSSFK